MRQLTTIFLSLMMLMVSAHVADAQSNTRIFDSLNYLNRSKPLQNPQFDRADDVLDHHILDGNNRVVGEVEDILLDGNGTVTSLNVELDRLHIRDNVFLNFNQLRIRTLAGSYALNIADDQIEEMLPTLLNNMSVAAGNENIFSLEKITEARLVAEDGRRLGKVDDVLFANDSARARALHVVLNYKSVRGEKLAIPFNLGRYQSKADVVEVVLNNTDADNILKFVDER